MTTSPLAKLSERIVKDTGKNIVTCGQCGLISMHNVTRKSEDYTCPHCGLEDDLSAFPDLLY